MDSNRYDYIIGIKDETAKGIARIRKSLSSISRIVPALSFAGMATFLKSTANAADEMGKLSQRIGIGVEDLGRLSYAAKLADVSQESLTTGVRALSRSISEAAQGSKEFAGVYASLGVSVKDAAGAMRGTNAIILDVADAFARLEDGATKTALAQKLFGRSGTELIPLLNSGARGIKELGDEAERIGLVFREDAAKQAEIFNDSLTRMQGAITGVGRQIAVSMLPALSDIADEMADAAAEGEGLMRVLRAMASGIGKAFQGSDAKQRGELLLQEIDLEKQLLAAKQRVTAAEADGAKARAFAAREAVERITKDLASVRARGQGLDVVMQDAAPKIEQGMKQSAEATRKVEDALAATTVQAEKLADVVKRLGLDKAADAAVDAFESASRELDALIESQNQAAASVFEGTRTPFERYLKDMNEVRKLHELNKISTETLARATRMYGEELDAAVAGAIPELEDLGDAMQETESFADSLGMTFSSAFEDAIVGGKKFSEVIKGLEQDILRMVTRKMVTEPLADMFGNMFGGGSGGGGIFSKLFGGARASGGPVESGRAYLVGERGPELFMPRQSGRIQASGAGGITINVHGVTDADSFRRSRTQVAAAAQFALARAGARNG